MARTAPRPLSVLFPDQYCWYILVCALDVMLTAVILTHLGGFEANGVARRVIESGGLPGLILFKFFTVVLVVLICEVIGRRKLHVARKLVHAAVALSSLPLVLGLGQIAVGLLTDQLIE